MSRLISSTTQTQTGTGMTFEVRCEGFLLSSFLSAFKCIFRLYSTCLSAKFSSDVQCISPPLFLYVFLPFLSMFFFLSRCAHGTPHHSILFVGVYMKRIVLCIVFASGLGTRGLIPPGRRSCVLTQHR
jgi:hypothetical protein